MKLFCFDIDGTILEAGGSFRQSTIGAIRNLQEKGHFVTIASGRPYSGIAPFLKPLIQEKLYAVALNGAAVYDNKGKLIYDNGFPFAVFEKFHNDHLSLIEKGMDIYCFTASEVCGFEDSMALRNERIWNNVQVRLLKENPLKPTDCIMKFMAVSDNIALVSDLMNHPAPEGLTSVKSTPRFCEYMEKKVDKAYGIIQLASLLGVSNHNDIVTFGDEGNDVKMLKDFYGIAMGNATPECQAVAKKVTLSCHDDGVSYAINNWFLE